MKRFGKIAASVGAVILFVGLVLFFPYPIKGVPEWRLRIVDQNGQAAIGAQVDQEWIDPDTDGYDSDGHSGRWTRRRCRLSSTSPSQSPRQPETVYSLHTRIYLLAWTVWRHRLVWRNTTCPDRPEAEGRAGLSVRVTGETVRFRPEGLCGKHEPSEATGLK
jgi:hypothetical protein